MEAKIDALVTAEKPLISVEPDAEHAAGNIAAVEQQGEPQGLLPELLLEIMKVVYAGSIGIYYFRRSSWKAALRSFMQASKTCYALGLPLFMRELDIEFSFRPEARLKFPNFLEDGLQMNKFSFVRKLTIRVAGGEENLHHFGTLLRRVGPTLEELEISLEELPTEYFEDQYEHLTCLKRLSITAVGVRHPGNKPADPKGFHFPVDMRAIPYLRLLFVAEDWDHLEELNVDYFEAHNCTASKVYPGAPAWPDLLEDLPKLTKKLHSLSVLNDEIEEWAELAPPNVKEFYLYSFGGDYDDWKRIDVFPGLEDSESTISPLRISSLGRFEISKKWGFKVLDST